MEMCLRVLKESNKSRFDSCSRQEQCIDHIPYYLSGLSRAQFFRQPFLEIAVYQLGSKVKRAGYFMQFAQVSALCNQYQRKKQQLKTAKLPGGKTLMSS